MKNNYILEIKKYDCELKHGDKVGKFVNTNQICCQNCEKWGMVKMKKK